MELVVDDPGFEEVPAHPVGVRLSEVAADKPDVFSPPVVRLQSYGETVHRLQALPLADGYDPPILIADQGDVAVALLGRGLVDVKKLHTEQIHPVQGPG